VIRDPARKMKTGRSIPCARERGLGKLYKWARMKDQDDEFRMPWEKRKVFEISQTRSKGVHRGAFILWRKKTEYLKKIDRVI